MLIFPVSTLAEDMSDSIHEAISGSVESTANFLDDFFVSERSLVEGTKSKAILAFINTYHDQGTSEQEYQIDVRLHLPNTENRFRLFIQNSVDFDSENDDSVFRSAENQEEGAGNYSAALQYIFAESKLWQVSSRAGVTFSIPADPFFRFRVRRLIPHQWFDTRLIQEFYWSDSEKFKEKTSAELERLLNKDYFTRLRYEFLWGEKERQFTFINGLSLYHKLKSNHVIRYDIGYKSIIENRFDLQRVFANIHYRRNIFKKWMFFELIPEIFRDETNWNKNQFQFYFKFGFVFGRATK